MCLDLEWISTTWNDLQFHREVATKLFSHETIFNFYMNNFSTIIEKKADFFIIKNKNDNERIIKFLNFSSTLISSIEIEEET